MLEIAHILPNAWCGAFKERVDDVSLRPGESGPAALPLLAADETPPFLVLNAGAASPFLLIGDHAGRAIPRRLGQLGLQAPDLDRHIAWDIGVADLGAALARSMDACFISQRFSRLVIDCNRDPARADSIVEVSDRTAIPGNAGLSAADRQARRAAVFDPYHARIAAELDDRAGRGLATTLVALHSFTPTMDGSDRPWRYGVLHLNDSPFSREALARLRQEPEGPMVGDNQPYQMNQVDYSVPAHAHSRGHDYLELEVRQDLLSAPAGVAQIADRLPAVLRDALAAVSV